MPETTKFYAECHDYRFKARTLAEATRIAEMLDGSKWCKHPHTVTITTQTLPTGSLIDVPPIG